MTESRLAMHTHRVHRDKNLCKLFFTERRSSLSQPSERTRALIVSKGTFQRFTDYVTEEDRIAEQREKEAAKVAMLKKATYEKTKTWENTIEVRLSIRNAMKSNV